MIMGSQFVLNDVEARYRSAQVDEVTVGDVPQTAVDADLLLHIRVYAGRSKQVGL